MSTHLLHLLIIILAAAAFQFQICSSLSPLAPTGGRNIILRLSGEVYDHNKGYFTASFDIGEPAKKYDLAIDTGSDLTWVLCDHETSGKDPKKQYYKPKKENILRCDDTRCKPFLAKLGLLCKRPDDICPYKIKFADKCQSSGFIVNDYFTFDGAPPVKRPMIFGCDTVESQKIRRCENNKEESTSDQGGMVGLMNGEKTSILWQLHKAGIIKKNAVGHCLGAKGGGFMFLGDVCLGIFESDGNTVGDISMQDRMMIFDNENKQIGWVTPADCNEIPKF